MSPVSVVVAGLDHGGQPFPIAARRGPLLTTSGINGLDPASGKIDADPRTQIAQTFANIASVLQAAGGDLDDITLVQVSLADLGHRDIVNEYWVQAFPDPARRPARNTIQRPLGGNTVCNVLVTAYIAERGNAGA